MSKANDQFTKGADQFGKASDQFKKFLDMQAQFFAPARAFNGFAAETFERISRQNYAVLGDYIDFAVEQARLPAQTANVNDYFTKQADASRSFGEKLYRRGQEYVEIVNSAAADAQAAVQKAA
jgi:phasin family protein